MICFTYLKVTIEVKTLLDKEIIMHNADKINQADRKKCYLYIAHAVNIFICIIVGYKNSLKNSFFSYNPGLERRFPFRYTIDEYTHEDLYNIFKKYQ